MTGHPLINRCHARFITRVTLRSFPLFRQVQLARRNHRGKSTILGTHSFLFNYMEKSANLELIRQLKLFVEHVSSGFKQFEMHKYHKIYRTREIARFYVNQEEGNPRQS